MRAKTKSGNATGFSERTSDIILVIICAVALFIVAYPLYYILIASVSNPYDVYAGKTFLFPSQFTLDGYKAVFADSRIVTGYLNSIKYTVIGTVFSVLMLYLSAYPLSVKDLPGRKFISIFFIFTMYFGGGLVPTYLVVKDTGLMNSMWALFLPGGVGVGNMIIMRNFFENSIPKEMIEAAGIDGASKWTTFYKIVVPLSRSIMAVMVVFSMVAYWNDWYNCMLYITNENMFTLQYYLQRMLGSAEAMRIVAEKSGIALPSVPLESMKMAMTVIATGPIVLLYPFVQRYFVKGLTIGAVKG